MDEVWTLVLPALLAGTVAVLVTVAIERLGGALGGILATLPSTIVPASLGMYATLDTAALTEALCTVPPGMLLNAAFLWLWRAVPPYLPRASVRVKLAGMVALSLGLWTCGAVALVTGTDLLLARGLTAPMLGGLGLAVLVTMGVGACWTGVPAPRGTRPVGAPTLVARGGLAAVAIFVALLLAEVGSPLLAGVASVFPAIFVTAMVSLWWSQGDAVSAGAVGPMMLGSAGVAVYALLAAALLPALGPAAGAVSAWLVAVLAVSVPAALWLRSRAGGDGGSRA